MASQHALGSAASPVLKEHPMTQSVTHDTSPAAQSFSAQLLGWTVKNSLPQPYGHTCTEWSNRGPQISGMTAMPAEMPAH